MQDQPRPRARGREGGGGVGSTEKGAVFTLVVYQRVDKFEALVFERGTKIDWGNERGAL